MAARSPVHCKRLLEGADSHALHLSHFFDPWGVNINEVDDASRKDSTPFKVFLSRALNEPYPVLFLWSVLRLLEEDYTADERFQQVFLRDCSHNVVRSN